MAFFLLSVTVGMVGGAVANVPEVDGVEKRMSVTNKRKKKNQDSRNTLTNTGIYSYSTRVHVSVLSSGHMPRGR